MHQAKRSSTERNREILADLIYQRECFTTEEIVDELRRHSVDGTAQIDGQTVGEYLDELRDLGALDAPGPRGPWRVLRYRSLTLESFHPVH